MEKRIVIVGAGVSGLLACKYALSKGFIPIVFEAEEKIGGVWAQTLESTRLQNTREIYQFSDFPWPASVKDMFPTHTQVVEYLEAYAQHFNIFPCIKFKSRVISVDYVGKSCEEMESWDLWGGTGKPFGSEGKWHIKVEDMKSCSIEVYFAEFVILCIGQFSGVPNIPEFPPQAGPEVFKGKVMHSMDYSALEDSVAAKLITGKRVAVIGSHKTAVDLAEECANINGVEYPCTIVQRNAHWLLPCNYFCGLMLDFLCVNRFSEFLVHKPGETLALSILATVLSPVRWGISKFIEGYLKWKFPLKKFGMLPKCSFYEDVASCQIAILPDKFYSRAEEGSIVIKNSQTFKFCKEGLILDSETESLESDIVIFATGFKGDEKLKNIFKSPIFQKHIIGSTTVPVPLYRQIIQPRIPQLAVVGYNESLSAMGCSEMKCLWLSHFLDGKLELPRIKDMEMEAKTWRKYIRESTGRYHRRACTGKINTWYNDQLCKDMGYNPRRKQGFLADLFLPYVPTDYAGLTCK